MKTGRNNITVGKIVARKKQDYRALKKELNKYHKFSFPMPRKGKDFTPQQKTAITKQFNKLRGILENEKNTTYIKYTKGKKYSGADGLRTNKGVIIQAPDATIKRDKLTGRDIVVRKSGPYLLKDYKFPQRVLLDPSLIENWVQRIIDSYGEHYDGVMWLRLATYNTSRYEAGMVNLYLTHDNMQSEQAKVGSLIGVTVIYR